MPTQSGGHGTQSRLKRAPQSLRVAAERLLSRTWLARGLSRGKLESSMKRTCSIAVVLLLAASIATAEDPKPTSTDHWSFHPVARPAVPPVRTPNSEIRNPIDHFILARLER